ncbi:hypothetical protein [Pontibacter mangrovi]|uniref:STAS/SEC14 domain-containing protein n=1 Tax=Pontibacter mangrovi TaxID=2589816 RepID=A0A501W8S7_9BACT|nr:hypothetical protein [Pontibacter mangrovi]TPE46019.1 hypothetical protein FJM65_01350 [Pontibacter mangrovi]
MMIFDSPYVHISFREERGLLLIQWLRKPDHAKLVEAYLCALDFVSSSLSTLFFYTDLTSIGPLSREQENWLTQEFYPKVYQCLQTDIFAAVVFSEDHFKAIVTNYQLPSAALQHHFIQFNYFTSQEEALQWLLDVKKGQDVANLPRIS